jgi:hypothetical protein
MVNVFAAEVATPVWPPEHAMMLIYLSALTLIPTEVPATEHVTAAPALPNSAAAPTEAEQSAAVMGGETAAEASVFQHSQCAALGMLPIVTRDPNPTSAVSAMVKTAKTKMVVKRKTDANTHTHTHKQTNKTISHTHSHKQTNKQTHTWFGEGEGHCQCIRGRNTNAAAQNHAQKVASAIIPNNSLGRSANS